MNNDESTEGRALSTQQIAALGSDVDDRPSWDRDPAPDSVDGTSTTQDAPLDSENPTSETHDPALDSAGPTSETHDPALDSEDPTFANENPALDSEDPTFANENPALDSEDHTPELHDTALDSEDRTSELHDTALDSEDHASELHDPALNSEDRASELQSPSVQSPALDAPAGQQVPAQQAAPVGVPGADDHPRTQLLADDELQNIHMQWKDIQSEFVDEPEKAVRDADALVAELMQRLAQMFASERSQLEGRWSGGGDVSTEDLRRSLRRYRSFFERLLAA